MKHLPLLLIALLVAACAQKQNPPMRVPPPECTELYVLLPENYIIDLQAESEVYLNPSRHEFIVFCSSHEAATAREEALKKDLLAKDAKWRIYKIGGIPQELAEMCHEKALCLSREARVVDWLPETVE